MMMMRKALCIVLLFLQWFPHTVSFVVVSKNVVSSIHPPTTGRSVSLPAAKQQPQEPEPQQEKEDDDLKSQAQELLRRAQEIRASLPDEPTNATTMTTPAPPVSEFRVDPSSAAIPGEGYRLHVSIGREEGTWMDARWGASGRRIDFSLDVLFCTPQSSTQDQDDDQNDNDQEPWRPQPDMASRMVPDNLGGRRSATWRLVTAPYARLQQGFDRMKLTTVEGAYRIDGGRGGGAQTARFLVSVEGTPEERGGRYGYVHRTGWWSVLGCQQRKWLGSMTHTLDFACGTRPTHQPILCTATFLFLADASTFHCRVLETFPACRPKKDLLRCDKWDGTRDGVEKKVVLWERFGPYPWPRPCNKTAFESKETWSG